MINRERVGVSGESLKRTSFQLFHSSNLQRFDLSSSLVPSTSSRPSRPSIPSTSSIQPTLATNENANEKVMDEDGERAGDGNEGGERAEDGGEDGDGERDGEVFTENTESNTPSWSPLKEEDEEKMEIIPTEDLPYTFIDDVSNTSTISTIVTNPNVYSHQVFPRSKEDIAKQQELFDTFIHQFDRLCDKTERGGKVVVMKPHRLSGLGNSIRTIMTGMYLAVITNRGMRCRS